MNKEAKYKDQCQQLKELNEIYQNFLALESERNRTYLIENNQGNNELRRNEVFIYDNLNKIEEKCKI